MSRIGIAVSILSVIFSSLVSAAPDPQAFDFGVGKLIPLLTISHKTDDNIYSQPIREESDSITQFQPALQFISTKDTSQLAVTYTGDFASYGDNNADNYSDHTFSFDALASPTDMYSIDFGASIAQLHDNRGEGSSEGANFSQRREPDEYDMSTLNLVVGIGRPSTRFGVEFEVNRNGVDYSNNRTETQFRDRDEALIAGRVYAQLAGKTRVFAEVSNEEFSYEFKPLVSPAIDSDESAVAVGITWEVTGKTTGTVKIGTLDKDFDSLALKSSDISTWDVNIIWSPRTYSNVFVSASSDSKETNGTGTFIESSDFSVTWQHGWSDRLRSTVAASVGDNDYQGSTRNDDLTRFSVGLDYDWHRWITIGASFTTSDRDSNNPAFDYDRNIFAIDLDMSL